MFAWMSATDVAFAMVAVTQAVLAALWWAGAALVADIRGAARHWAAFAAFTALGFALLILALHLGPTAPAQPVRAVGNLAIVFAVLLLRRGVRIFLGRPDSPRLHLATLLAALVASVVGLLPAGEGPRVVVLSALLSLVALAVSRDLYLYARDGLRFRWPGLVAAPGLLTVFGFTWRGLRVLVWPASVSSEITVDSPLNVASGIGYVIVVLAFHATLFALVIGRLVADLRHRARHDDLTGLLNRRVIEEGIEAQIRRSRRSGEPFSVLMLDVDHFKSVNDRFGHAVGDEALRHVAAMLRAGLREVDAIARIGGEEFVALMPGATLAAVTPIADRLRERLAGQPLVVAGEAVPVTVSIGVAEWSDAAEDLSRLLVRADAALYQAKQQGRNRVVGADAAAASAATPGPQPASAWRP